MKKNNFYIAFGAILLSLASCDYIMKPTKSENILTDSEDITDIILGEDSDENGCVTSAGYKWSIMREECIRIFEKGIRLIPANEKVDVNEDEVDLAMLNAYLLFNEDQSKAEVFIYSEKETVVLDKVSQYIYKAQKWELNTENQYKLLESGALKFVSAQATEKQIEGDLEYNLTDAVITE